MRSGQHLGGVLSSGALGEFGECGDGTDEYGFGGGFPLWVYIGSVVKEVYMTVTEIEVDDRGRASLRGAGIAPGRYRVSRAGDAFKLERVKSYTDAELFALSDPEVIEAHQSIRNHPDQYSPADDLP